MIIEALLAKMKKLCYESVLTDCKCAKMYHGVMGFVYIQSLVMVFEFMLINIMVFWNKNTGLEKLKHTFKNLKIIMIFAAAYGILQIGTSNQFFESLMKGNIMSVSYNGLWKLLIDKNMYKKDLAAELSISSATMAKMGKGENVSMDVLQKICEYLECDIGDILSFKTESK